MKRHHSSFSHRDVPEEPRDQRQLVPKNYEERRLSFTATVEVVAGITRNSQVYGTQFPVFTGGVQSALCSHPEQIKNKNHCVRLNFRDYLNHPSDKACVFE